VDESRAARRAGEYLAASAEAVRKAQEACLEDVVAAAEIMAAALHRGRKILICGNGGSAADAQHLAAELVSCLTTERVRQALPAVALSTDTSILTAIGNDFGFEGVFERQVEALGQPGDVLLAISTSGNSPNVLRAADRAASLGMRTIALTGGDGGKLRSATDVAVCVPVTSTGHVQEAHTALEHLLVLLVEEELFPEAGA
jgi:D-sedoheptulose 7-phosphate isomerase